jgi:hypothetical protein
MSTLKAALARFDGTHTAELVEALDLGRENRGELVALCGDTDVAVAATWVIKALVEKGEAVDVAAVFETLFLQTEWPAQLHVLQCAQYDLDAAAAHIEAIRSLMRSPKVLVRVWAMDAFVRGAVVQPDLRGQASKMVEAALSGGAASLRARARELKVICATW